MTLFDPYSHARLRELRPEQLARNARRREELQLDSAVPARALTVSTFVRKLILRPAPAAKVTAKRPAGARS